MVMAENIPDKKYRKNGFGFCAYSVRTTLRVFAADTSQTWDSSAPIWEKVLQGEKKSFCDDILFLLRGKNVHYICVLAQFLLFEIFGVENNLN